MNAREAEAIARRHFGVARDLAETGYILSDGTRLDLSGRHYASGYVRKGASFVPKRGEVDYLRGGRNVDHRELPDEIRELYRDRDTHSAGMLGFLELTGALRVMPGVGFSVVRMPTIEALASFMKGWKDAYGNDEVIVDVISPEGETLSSIVVSDPTLEKLEAQLESLGPNKASLSGGESFYEQLAALRPKMAAEAQKIYDEWEQDEEGFDEEFGAGGVCDRISEAIGTAIAQAIADVEFFEAGQDGDDHAWLVVQLGNEAYGVDIPAGVYESGGGYRWTKRPGVKFTPDHILIFRVDP